MKKIAVLSSGRADYSIYLPLLRFLEKSKEFELTIIAFGSHTSHYHGYSIDKIYQDGFKNIISIDALLSDDKKDSIAISMGITLIRFAEIWKDSNFDLVVSIGDRYEMFAAVSSVIPFNIKVAHFHGGEKTLGAIDNSFRHSISSLSDIHFTTCDAHKNRVEEIVEKEDKHNVFNIGSLSLQNINHIKLLSKKDFLEKFNYDLTKPTILFTYHPETKDLSKNEENLNNILEVFDKIEENILITLPNNDSMGAFVRKRLLEYEKINNRVKTFDFLGTQGYFSAMHHCVFMMGNSSSGIIEAASFGCNVLNIGNRQKGRLCSGNILHCSSSKDDILREIINIKNFSPYDKENIYYQENSIEKFITIIKEYI